MKMFRILILILFVFSSGFVLAQTDNLISLDKEIQELSQAYHLDKAQEASLQRILVRKQEMLKGIQFHKESDFDRFLELRRTIYKGTEGSIKMILKEDQMDYFKDEAIRKRKLNGERVKVLKSNGAEKQRLIDAGLGIEW